MLKKMQIALKLFYFIVIRVKKIIRIIQMKTKLFEVFWNHEYFIINVKKKLSRKNKIIQITQSLLGSRRLHHRRRLIRPMRLQMLRCRHPRRWSV